jgi:hypothetical protein
LVSYSLPRPSMLIVVTASQTSEGSPVCLPDSCTGIALLLTTDNSSVVNPRRHPGGNPRSGLPRPYGLAELYRINSACSIGVARAPLAPDRTRARHSARCKRGDAVTVQRIGASSAKSVNICVRRPDRAHGNFAPSRAPRKSNFRRLLQAATLDLSRAARP